MLAHRISITSLLTVVMLICAALLIGARADGQASAQEKAGAGSAPAQSDKARGIELYRKGDLKGAIEALNSVVKKDQTDADAWHFLGLAYYSNDEAKNARKAFEVETKLRPDSADARVGLAYSLLLDNKFSAASVEAERALTIDAKNAGAHYIVGINHFKEGERQKALGEAEASIKANPNFAAAHLLKVQILLNTSEWAIVSLPGETDEARNSRLNETRASLAAYLKLYPKAPNREMLHELLESLNMVLKPSNTDENKRDTKPGIFSPKDLAHKAIIQSRAEPRCTLSANQAAASGVVVIRAVFASDGRVKYIRAIIPLPYGLTDEAIRAARGIRFRPAMKDGHPASQYVQIEYHFSC
jgi:tetratricopeptide (TPR) repeat protein